MKLKLAELQEAIKFVKLAGAKYVHFCPHPEGVLVLAGASLGVQTLLPATEGGAFPAAFDVDLLGKFLGNAKVDPVVSEETGAAVIKAGRTRLKHAQAGMRGPTPLQLETTGSLRIEHADLLKRYNANGAVRVDGLAAYAWNGVSACYAPVSETAQGSISAAMLTALAGAAGGTLVLGETTICTTAQGTLWERAVAQTVPDQIPAVFAGLANRPPKLRIPIDELLQMKNYVSLDVDRVLKISGDGREVLLTVSGDLGEYAITYASKFTGEVWMNLSTVLPFVQWAAKHASEIGVVYTEESPFLLRIKSIPVMVLSPRCA